MGRLNLTKLIPRRFRKKSHQSIEPCDPYLHFTVTRLQDHVARHQLDLEDALEEVTQLRNQIAEYDFLLCIAQTRLPNLMPLPPTEISDNVSSRSSLVSPTSSPVPAWIDDIWPCTEASKEHLKSAECHWLHDAPRVALEVVLKTIQDPFLSSLEQTYYYLFTAAVQSTLERYQPAVECLEKVFHMLEDPDESYGDSSRELTGLAYYIQGRLLIATGDLEAAYVSLSRAQGTPGLHSMARTYQQAIIVESTNVVTDDSASIGSSLRPCRSTGSDTSATSIIAVAALSPTRACESQGKMSSDAL